MSTSPPTSSIVQGDTFRAKAHTERRSIDKSPSDDRISAAESPASGRLDLAEMEGKIGFRGLFENIFVLGITCFATLGGFLFGYDQGVVGNVLAIQSFGAAFPEIYTDANLKGWFVSTLLLGAWLGSLINGPICDRIGRRRNIMVNVIIFLLGSSLQTGATAPSYLFGGRAVSGLAVGALTHVVPMYLAEISSANVRGSLVALQQLSITIGILISYWIAYGTSHIGGTRCAPGVPYTGPLLNGQPTFDPYNDVPAGGCTGQSQASWRIPVGLQLVPAICLGIGMIFMPYSPRWLMEQGRETEALATLSRLRRRPEDARSVQLEFLEIKAEVRYAAEARGAKEGQHGRVGRALANYMALVSSWPKFKRLAVGCLVMFYQQFMGCNAIIYYAPTIFGQLGLDPTTTSLLATGVYGIVNTLSTLPAVVLLDSTGRRPLLMSGAIGCFAALVVVGSLVAAFSDDWPNHMTAGRAAIAFVFIYDVNFSYSYAPIGWVLPSEIFPLELRSTGISITTSCTWMSNFVIGLVSPTMLAQIPNGGTYFFFAAFSLCAFFTTLFFIPETRGKTLEEMDSAFGDNSTDVERERMEAICRELGLPAKALASV
ncbi:D-xylose-proton symporter [Coniophora puteana RWD-64-598 SS2]|uniref:D-xylose-proton symporter n=1 Tax=Coniophora puteana (strain RWD-64-598) TaxID=741705 RepID=A0A5M3MWB6_CONPW|nr:D-xylose-proton symporter [Coniophora puteana RWD-64-598 SS2]EIW83360.1 D-xylose-proton symporter [Coniophora puteana RWD-64-598 SS2]